MRHPMQRASALLLLAFGASLSLSACAGLGSKAPASAYANSNEDSKISLSGMFGGKKDKPVDQQAGIGVNAYLWRASLDTISFMPLTSADPWGGVILTDWYSNPQTPDERFKITIFILDARLRADALNVSVQKETRAGDRWVTAAASQQTQLDIENAILSRARELRLSDVKD